MIGERVSPYTFIARVCVPSRSNVSLAINPKSFYCSIITTRKFKSPTTFKKTKKPKKPKLAAQGPNLLCLLSPLRARLPLRRQRFISPQGDPDSRGNSATVVLVIPDTPVLIATTRSASADPEGINDHTEWESLRRDIRVPHHKPAGGASELLLSSDSFARDE